MEYDTTTREYAERAARKAANHLANLGGCSWGTWKERAELLFAQIDREENRTNAMECVGWLIGQYE